MNSDWVTRTHTFDRCEYEVFKAHVPDASAKLRSMIFRFLDEVGLMEEVFKMRRGETKEGDLNDEKK